MRFCAPPSSRERRFSRPLKRTTPVTSSHAVPPVGGQYPDHPSPPALLSVHRFHLQPNALGSISSKVQYVFAARFIISTFGAIVLQSRCLEMKRHCRRRLPCRFPSPGVDEQCANHVWLSKSLDKLSSASPATGCICWPIFLLQIGTGLELEVA
jgi:hypothetical protein